MSDDKTTTTPAQPAKAATTPAKAAPAAAPVKAAAKTAAEEALEQINAQQDGAASDQDAGAAEDAQEPEAVEDGNVPVLATLKTDHEYHNGTFRNTLKAGARISSQHYDFGKMLRNGAKLEATIEGTTIELDASMFQ